MAYWFSPIKNLFYILSPLLFAVFAIPVFYTSIAELLVFWFPMFLLSDISLHIISGRSISSKWSGIYEISVMPHLLIPIIKESLGISMSKFKVTDKTAISGKRARDFRAMIPFLVFMALSIAGIVRVCVGITLSTFIQQIVILFWLLRNLYFLILAIFIIDGRDSSGEPVRVIDAEPITLDIKGRIFEGITTRLNEHRIRLMLDDFEGVRIGDAATVQIYGDTTSAKLSGVIIDAQQLRRSNTGVYELEILDYCGQEMEYLQIIYDRLPTLPMERTRDFGIATTLWRNIAGRIRRPDA